MLRRPRALAAGLALLLLASFVSPFSYLPNPVGLYYLVFGGYRYDPRSPFVNRFATLATPDPTPTLTPQLERLLGLTGLDPLDPEQPLVGYRVRAIVTRRAIRDGVSHPVALVEFRYAGGGARTYPIPVYQYGDYVDAGTGRTGWRYTGLDRLFAAHLALPDLPPAATDDAFRIDTPRPTGSALDLGPAFAGGWASGFVDPLVRARWSPDGRRFALTRGDTGGGGPLWVASPDGAPPRQVAARALDAAWAADGHLAYLRCPTLCALGATVELVVADPATGAERVAGRAPGRALALAGGVAYLLDGERLWRLPLDGSAGATPLGAAFGAGLPLGGAPLALALPPDGGRLAYGCGGDVCLADPDGGDPARVALGFPAPPTTAPGAGAAPGGSALPPTVAPVLPSSPVPTAPSATAIAAPRRPRPLASLALAWSPDGARLAIATGVYPGGDRGPELWIVDRVGHILRRLSLGPDGATGAPAWTPDGGALVLTTFPRNGRRIVAIDAIRGRVTDLSRPRWDAFAALAPDGERLLLWNGAGHFWLAPLVRRADGR